MKFKHDLSKYMLVSIETNKPVGLSVRLTKEEAQKMNYAYAMNRSGVKYQKV